MRTSRALRESAPLVSRLLEQQPGQEHGVYRVVLIAEGKGNPRDRHYYPRELLEKSARVFEGVAAFADHADRLEEETRPERSVRDMIGWYQNVRPERVDGKTVLAGDLVTIPGPSYQWVRDLLNAAVVKRQTTGGDLVGLSINANGMTSPREIDGEPWEVVEEIVGGASVDLVTQAGAGGRIVSLKESFGCLENDQACRLEQRLRALNDPLVAPMVTALAQLRETREGRNMAKTARKPGGSTADELERRVRLMEAEVFGAKDEEEEPEEDKTEEVSFADWAGGEEGGGLEERIKALEDRLAKIEKAVGASEAKHEEEPTDDEAKVKEKSDKEKADDKADDEVKVKEKSDKEMADDEAEDEEKIEESLRVPMEVVRAVARKAYEKAKAKSPEAILRENALLRAELARRREVDRAKAILREKRVPPAAWGYLFEFMLGRSEQEQRRFVESYLASMVELIDRDERVRQTPKSGEEGVADLTASLAEFDIPMVGRA